MVHSGHFRPILFHISNTILALISQKSMPKMTLKYSSKWEDSTTVCKIHLKIIMESFLKEMQLCHLKFRGAWSSLKNLGKKLTFWLILRDQIEFVGSKTNLPAENTREATSILAINYQNCSYPFVVVCSSKISHQKQ